MSYEPTVWVDGDHVTSAKLNKLEQGVNSMSYTPTVWNAGDVVTAEKLNKLEQGVAEGGGGGVDYPTFTVGESLSCDMTYAEARANLLANCDTNYMWIAKWMWDGGELVTSWLSDAEVIQEDFEDVPETVTEGIALTRASDATFVYALFAEDGNFYKPKS